MNTHSEIILIIKMLDNIIEKTNEHEENIVQEDIMENISEESEDEEMEDEKVCKDTHYI